MCNIYNYKSFCILRESYLDEHDGIRLFHILVCMLCAFHNMMPKNEIQFTMQNLFIATTNECFSSLIFMMRCHEMMQITIGQVILGSVNEMGYITSNMLPVFFCFI